MKIYDFFSVKFEKQIPLSLKNEKKSVSQISHLPVIFNKFIPKVLFPNRHFFPLCHEQGEWNGKNKLKNWKQKYWWEKVFFSTEYPEALCKLSGWWSSFIW